MAVRNKDEVIQMIKDRIGEDVSDEALQLLEDVTDTVNDYDRRVTESGDWQRKYEENDAGWRRRYRERFENAPSVETPDTVEEFVPTETAESVDDEINEPETYEELFSYE